MNPWSGLKGLPHDMWALFITTLLNRSGTMVIPFLTLYLTREIGVTPAEAGTVLLVYGGGALLTSPFMGRLADKIGALKVMKYSLFGTGIMFIIYSFAESYFIILLITFFLSMISEAFRPANLSYITEIVTPPQRRMAFALNRLAINIGMSIGPVIGGFLTLIDYDYLFYANAITSVAAGIYIVFTKWTASEGKLPEEITGIKISASILSDKRYLYFLLSIVPVNLVFFQILGALPLYIVEDLKYTTAAYGILLAINTVLIIIAEVPINNYMSNISYKKSLIIGALLTGIGFGATALATTTLMLVITIIIWTFGEMIFFPVSASYASEIAPPNKRGEYMGYYQTTFNFAFSAGPWLGTVVYQNYGSSVLWMYAFIFGLMSAFMLALKKQQITT
jgi:predicted MFS family arabinose efflux permease